MEITGYVIGETYNAGLVKVPVNREIEDDEWVTISADPSRLEVGNVLRAFVVSIQLKNKRKVVDDANFYEVLMDSATEDAVSQLMD